jgi:UDP-glucose 4-epimerase
MTGVVSFVVSGVTVGVPGGVVSIFNRNLHNGEPIVIFGDGSQERSFTFVEDVVWANLMAMANIDSDGQIYNCASGISVTINQLAKAIKELHGKPEHPVIYRDWLPGDIKHFDIDNRKIRRDFNIEFETDLIEGLKKTFFCRSKAAFIILFINLPC